MFSAVLSLKVEHTKSCHEVSSRIARSLLVQNLNNLTYVQVLLLLKIYNSVLSQNVWAAAFMETTTLQSVTVLCSRLRYIEVHYSVLQQNTVHYVD